MTFTEYQGKRVIVTGTTSGIGQALTAELLRLGAEVHGLGRGDRPLGVATASYQDVDLTDPDAISSALQAVRGQVDVLFNVAGALPMAPPLEILKVNFLGAKLLTEIVGEHMNAGASVVNVSSDGGYGWRKHRELVLDFLTCDSYNSAVAWYESHSEQAGHPYSFSKEALDVWTMQQAAVLIKRGIRINTVSPGAVQTPMLAAIESVFPAEMISVTEQPSGRRSTPEEQVGPLLFLGSNSASYVNGADIAVDGGYWATLNLAGALW